MNREHDTADDELSVTHCGPCQPQCADDGEPEWSLEPQGATKSAEAFRARGLHDSAKRRARVEVRQLNVFLRRAGSDTVEFGAAFLRCRGTGDERPDHYAT